ncbi:MAG: glycosyltransferase family 4 protein [Alicyclobacillaceae bacterium]|nr:glycosyltransferase family 4 protein [Alicyclobacillaceae bacterium]
MRIVYVITRSDAIGGAHVHVRDLALNLIRQGHAVTVLVGGKGPFTKELAAQGVPYRSLRHLVRPIRPGTDLRGLWELRATLAQLRPDLVATHSSKAGWLGRMAARSLRIPVIFTAHGWAFTEGVPEGKRRVYALAERLAAPFADRIITVSEYDRRLALRYRIAPAHKLVLVHNGMPDVAPVLRARPESEPVRLVMVARFEPPKDHVTLLRALAGLRELAWELELIGDGPLLESVREEAGRLGLLERVCFLGTRKDVAERLAGAQLFVLASNWEGLPLSILEAMRAGLPVVASDVGGVREALVEGENGFLVPRGDEETLRARLRQLLSAASLRRKMGQAGRRRFQELFTFERMLGKTLEVYKTVLDAKLAQDGACRD